MSHDTSSTALMQAHVELQMGTYFSDLSELEFGVCFASSSRISDYYWNYAYGLKCSPKELPDRVREIREYSGKLSRTPTIYSTPDTRPEHLGEILAVKEAATEVWMTLDKDHGKQLTIPSELRVSPVSENNEMEHFIRVFRDAYGSGSPDSPGYSGLPEEYPDSIRHAAPAGSVQVAHFVGWEGIEPVAISSIFSKPPYAGLYNVGITHEARRKGYGTIMSHAAIAHAFANGSETVLLQTEADSPVEELYQKLGFQRKFLGEFLVLS